MGSGSSFSSQLLLIAILTLTNAFFSGAEIAIISSNKKKLKKLDKEGNEKAKLLLKVIKEPSRFLSTIQVGITFAGFFSSASAAIGISDDLGRLLTGLGVPFGKNVAFVGVTFILSYIMLVFGELVPKRIAMQNSEKFALFAIKPISFISKLMKPFVAFLSISTNAVLKILGFKTKGVEEKVTLEELKSLFEVGQEQGLINLTEREMLFSVISFDDKVAEEIMTARTEVFMININEPLETYIDSMLSLKHSRIPVYDDYIDNVIGILYLKDFILEAYKVGFDKIDIKKIMRIPYFIPEHKNINDLFIELQSSKNHFAVLIDEYGGFSGIVTMEDLIEEIMGDIYDEYDIDEPDIFEVEENIYRAKGALSIKELNSKLDLKIDENSDFYDTLGGLLIYLLGYIPEDGQQEKVEYMGAEFYILEIKNRRIIKVQIKVKKE
ncbi:MAG: HlyC/CorC family transporter [Clostridium sp.]|nr:HlyC/CorC family transporter [Clostridium sp.]